MTCVTCRCHDNDTELTDGRSELSLLRPDTLTSSLFLIVYWHAVFADIVAGTALRSFTGGLFQLLIYREQLLVAVI